MNEDKILSLFFENSEKTFHIREIARLTNLNPNTVIKYCKGLVKKGLITEHNTSITKNLAANKDKPAFFFEKKIYNIKKIYYSGLIGRLVEAYNHPDAIILFGSYSKGEDTPMGDIDLAVITRKSLTPDLSAYEKKLNRKIHVMEIVLEKAEGELVNNLSNGIVLSGRLVVR